MSSLAMVAAEGRAEAAGEPVGGGFQFILANPLAFAILPRACGTRPGSI